jgi:hypothetical protein
VKQWVCSIREWQGNGGVASDRAHDGNVTSAETTKSEARRG